ncbi:hypothetical protein ACQHIV_39405 [Kribbella sp. GL6]|uniref:hypothetical protein n=1 Tax=Kribbella sp. GL6 TaxID=3419765 RepID=UPI003D07C891
MTDDLKHKFEQLVADPPPPSTEPSQAVFARVRTARRRRTAGAVTLAAAAVVAVAFAIGNVTDIDGRPPVSNTPTVPMTAVTPAPSSPTAMPSTQATGATATTEPPVAQNTNTPNPGDTPPPTSNTSTNTPAPPAVGVHVRLTPTVTGRTVTVKVTVSGTVLVPTADGKDLPKDTSFLNLSGGTNYYWGDGQQGGSDGGAVQCGGKTVRSGRETYSIDTHTYTKAGTYTLRYEVSYCNANGSFKTVKTAKVTVK